jgi:ABC-type transport system involved in cytochrome bd biosynthesis fused ATPase/permease subunit
MQTGSRKRCSLMSSANLTRNQVGLSALPRTRPSVWTCGLVAGLAWVAAAVVTGLSQFASAYPHRLSGGMAQRVSLARVADLRRRILGLLGLDAD